MLSRPTTQHRCRPQFCLTAALALAACATGPGTGTVQEPAASELPPISPNRPTFSDGTSLVPLGHAQIETGYTFTQRDDPGVEATRHNAPEVVARYRLLETLEARLLWGGYAWGETESGGATSRAEGGTDPALGFVMPIVDQRDWVPAFAFEALTTLGAGSEEFSSGHADPTLKLLWSYGGGHLPDWLGIGGNFNASWPTESGERYRQTAASLYAFVTPSGGDTSWFAEWYVISPYSKDSGSAHHADFGVVQRLNRTTAIDARLGFGLDDDADDFFAGVGISFLF
jgi:hypothetical protein